MRFNKDTFKVSSHYWAKHIFDPTDPTDLAEYAYFLQNNKWKDGCPFILEWPFSNIISMVEDKFIKRHIMSHIKLAKKK